MLAQRHVTAVVSCLVVVLLWVVTLTMVSFNQVRAVELTMTSVRLERQQAAVSPGKILVQFRTDENVTEDGVQVTIGQAWTQSAVANDYTISTAGLPVGVAAPPGVTTASSVVGKTVTFPVADLNAGVTYGFYLMGGIASNPAPGSGFDYVWTITTLVGGVPSSSQEVGVPVLASDQITINATVGPTIGEGLVNFRADFASIF